MSVPLVVAVFIFVCPYPSFLWNQELQTDPSIETDIFLFLAYVCLVRGESKVAGKFVKFSDLENQEISIENTFFK